MHYTCLGKWALIDIETTGLSPDDSEIIDVGIICFEEKNYEGSYRFNFLPKNIEILPDWLTVLTGLRIEDLSDPHNGKEEEKWEKICELLKDRVLIAHNADFEKKFLQPIYSKSQNGSESLIFIDSLELLPLLFPYLGKYGLEYLLSYGGVTSAEIHRGLEDSQDLLKVLLFYSTLFNQDANSKLRIATIFSNEALSWWKVFVEQSPDDFKHYADSISFNLEDKLKKFHQIRYDANFQPALNLDFSKDAISNYLNKQKKCDELIKKISLKVCQVLKNNLFCFYQCSEKLINDELAIETICLMTRSFKRKVLIFSLDENRELNALMQYQNIITVNQFLLKHFLEFKFTDEKLIAIQKSQQNHQPKFFFLPEFLRYESTSIDHEFNLIYQMALEDWYGKYIYSQEDVFFIQSRDLESLPHLDFGHHLILTEKPNWEYSIPLHYQYLQLESFFLSNDFYVKYFSNIIEKVLLIRENQTYKQSIFSIQELEINQDDLINVFKEISCKSLGGVKILENKIKYFLQKCENVESLFYIRFPIEINENSFKKITFFCEDHYLNFIDPIVSSAFIPSWYFAGKSLILNSEIIARNIPINKQFNSVQNLLPIGEEKLAKLDKIELNIRFKSIDLESDDFIQKIFPVNLSKPKLVLFTSSDYQVSVPFYNYLKMKFPTQVKSISELRSEKILSSGPDETIVFFSWEKNSFKKSEIQKKINDYPWDILIFDKIPDISWGYLEQELWKKNLRIEASKGEDTKLTYWKKRAEFLFHRVAAFVLNDKRPEGLELEVFIVDHKMLNWKIYTKNQFMEGLKIFFKGVIRHL